MNLQLSQVRRRINWDNVVWWKPNDTEQVLTVTMIQCMDEDKMINAKDAEIKKFA